MERYADGDDSQFVPIYDALAPRLLQFLERMARSRADAEELMQLTFLRMHDARGRFRPGAAVEPWAFAIARRVFIDHHRRRRETPDPEAAGRLIEQHGDGESAMVATETMASLAAALDGLPPRQREVFEMLRFDGLSIAEVAEVLGITTMAAKLRAHRAYHTLRSAIELDDRVELP